METKIKKIIFLTFILSELLLSQVPTAVAQTNPAPPSYTNSGAESSIKKYLCTPTDASSGGTGVNNKAGNDLYNCINKLYRFALVITSIVSVFMIIIAGYMYMTAEGSSEAISKAKSIITSSIASILILLMGYVFLKALNPDLIHFQNIQPPEVRNVPSTGQVPVTPETGQPPITSSNVQALATQILNNSGNINLSAVHSSGVADNATAIQNIKDAAAGKPATRSSYQNAPGGSVQLNSAMLSALADIGSKYKIGVSEIAGGSHTGLVSDHYEGNAFDINFVNGQHLISGNQYIPVIMALCTQDGAGQVIDESASANHVHCGKFSLITPR